MMSTGNYVLILRDGFAGSSQNSLVAQFEDLHTIWVCVECCENNTMMARRKQGIIFK